MTVTRPTVAEKMGHLIAELLRDRNDVVDIRVRQRDDIAELWLFVDAPNIDEEHGLHRINQELHQHFPDQVFDLRIADVKMFGGVDYRLTVPSDSRRIEM